MPAGEVGHDLNRQGRSRRRDVSSAMASEEDIRAELHNAQHAVLVEITKVLGGPGDYGNVLTLAESYAWLVTPGNAH
jgi:hypothetical protein